MDFSLNNLSAAVLHTFIIVNDSLDAVLFTVQAVQKLIGAAKESVILINILPFIS